MADDVTSQVWRRRTCVTWKWTSATATRAALTARVYSAKAATRAVVITASLVSAHVRKLSDDYWCLLFVSTTRCVCLNPVSPLHYNTCSFSTCEIPGAKIHVPFVCSYCCECWRVSFIRLVIWCLYQTLLAGTNFVWRLERDILSSQLCYFSFVLRLCSRINFACHNFLRLESYIFCIIYFASWYWAWLGWLLPYLIPVACILCAFFLLCLL